MTRYSVVLGLLLAGCAGEPAPIGASFVPVVVLPERIQSTILTDFQSTAFNLDEAVRVGALQAEDPAPKCLHEAMKQLGLEGDSTPAASFQPKRDGLLSEGAILYIRAQQLKRLQGTGVTVPVDCQALIGRLLLDNAAALTKGLPGGGLLPSIR